MHRTIVILAEEVPMARISQPTWLAVVLFATTIHAATSVPTADMPVEREGAAAVLLSSGKVLVAGGRSLTGGSDYLAAAHLYDPQTATWAATGSMTDARSGAAAALLPDGRVLVVGGTSFSIPGPEIYDPLSGSWSAATAIPGSRVFFGATATALSTGKILVVGRSHADGSGDVPVVFDPATSSWSQTASMIGNRVTGHTATRLLDGRVLVTGGAAQTGVSGPGNFLHRAEIYDPSANTWSAAPSMSELRENHAATLLPDGRVIVVGGRLDHRGGSGVPSASVDVFDPASGTWAAAAPLPRARTIPSASLLPNGTVLVTGGRIQSGTTIFSTDIFDPATGTWTFGPDMSSIRSGHISTMLPDGRILLAGGSAGGTFLSPTHVFPSAELFDHSAFAPVIGGGRRPAIDFFLGYSGTYVTDRISTISNTNPGSETQVVVFLVTASNGETVFPQTAQMTLNGASVALPPLPAQGIVPIRVPLATTSNVLLASIDGVIPGSSGTATDSDRLVIKCEPPP